MLASFGAGRLYGFRTDVSGATPVEFGVLQGVDRDFSFTTKPIFGSNQFAVFVARGEAKWTLKAKFGIISGLLFNNLFFGQTMTTGQITAAMGEAHTLTSTSPFVVTPNVTAGFKDLGVTYSGNPALPLTNTPSGPAGGQYSVNSSTGVYTFNSADASTALLFNYEFTTSVGEQIAITNQLLGTTPYFGGVFRNRDPATGKFETFVFNRMTANKLNLSSKTSDYTIPELDIEVLDDGTGNIGTMSFGDLS